MHVDAESSHVEIRTGDFSSSHFSMPDLLITSLTAGYHKGLNGLLMMKVNTFLAAHKVSLSQSGFRLFKDSSLFSRQWSNLVLSSCYFYCLKAWVTSDLFFIFSFPWEKKKTLMYLFCSGTLFLCDRHKKWLILCKIRTSYIFLAVIRTHLPLLQLHFPCWYCEGFC